MLKTNLHTHTVWCDGRATAEAMVLEAVRRDFAVLGFSSHVAFPEPQDGWHLMPEKAPAYVAEIRRLADVYQEALTIHCGVEADYIAPDTRHQAPGTTPDRSRYAYLGIDYIIGSVHTVVAPDGGRVSVDDTPEKLQAGIAAHFGGDARAFVEAYFDQQTEMLRYDFDIVGHPDLVRKFNAKHPYFDETAPWYLAARRRFAEALAKSGKLTEVNTGAIARGWLDDAYPAADWRPELEALGVRMIYGSDAHAPEGLDCGWDRFGG